VIAAVLLAVVLGAPPVTPWVERDGSTLHLTAPLDQLVDGDLRRRLRSGLTTTLRLQIWLEGHEDGRVHGVFWRVARARWDLWEEHLTAIVDGPEGSRTERHADLDAFARAFARLEALPLARGIAQDDAVYRVRVRIEVNPLSEEQAARMRRWLALPGAPSALDPLGRGLMGSFVRFFDNLKPGVAERTIVLTGHPFRGDRLPYLRQRGADGAP
jgi:hypothetical protein